MKSLVVLYFFPLGFRSAVVVRIRLIGVAFTEILLLVENAASLNIRHLRVSGSARGRVDMKSYSWSSFCRDVHCRRCRLSRWFSSVFVGVSEPRFDWLLLLLRVFQAPQLLQFGKMKTEVSLGKTLSGLVKESQKEKECNAQKKLCRLSWEVEVAGPG